MRREVLVIEEAFEQHVRVCARPEMHYYYYYYYYRARGGDGGQGGSGRVAQPAVPFLILDVARQLPLTVH